MIREIAATVRRGSVWHALARASEMFPSPLLTRNQVEMMQIDTRVIAGDAWICGTGDFAALGRGNAPEDAIELRMKEAPRLIRFHGGQVGGDIRLHSAAGRPRWVNLVVLTVGQPLPVYPDKADILRVRLQVSKVP